MRPTRQMTGDHEFTEEFLDAARAPLSNVIGGLNNGWRVTMSTLGLDGAETRRQLISRSGGWSATCSTPCGRAASRRTRACARTSSGRTSTSS